MKSSIIAILSGQRGFSVSNLFAQAEQGVWYDPSDLSTLFQDSAGTTPVTATGQPVGLMLDKSGNNNHALQIEEDWRPIYRSSGGLSWLELDPAQLHYLITSAIDFSHTSQVTAIVGMEKSGNPTRGTVFNHNGNGFNVFTLEAPRNADDLTIWYGAGDSALGSPPAVGLALDTPIVYSGITDLSGTTTLREDGIGNEYAAAFGGGSFGNGQLCLGTYAPGVGGRLFNGKIHSLVIVDGNISRADLLNSEKHTAQKSGATITPVDVIVLVGQSNMVGRADDNFSGSYPSGTLQYAYSDKLIKDAATPLDHFDERTGDMGLARQFAIDYAAANAASQLLIVPRADGGTGFDDNNWNPGDVQYAATVTDVNALFTDNPNFRLKGFLWHQGEQDAGSDTYAADLEAMITQMRTDITVASGATPFILGLIKTTSSGYDADINAAISDVPNNLTATAVVAVEDLTFGDSVHFDANSLDTLGSRYFTALSNL